MTQDHHRCDLCQPVYDEPTYPRDALDCAYQNGLVHRQPLVDAVGRVLSRKCFQWQSQGMGQFRCRGCGAKGREEHLVEPDRTMFTAEPCSSTCPWEQLATIYWGVK